MSKGFGGGTLGNPKDSVWEDWGTEQGTIQGIQKNGWLPWFTLLNLRMTFGESNEIDCQDLIKGTCVGLQACTVADFMGPGAAEKVGNENRAPGFLGYIRDYTTQFWGIILNHYKDRYQPTSIMESKKVFFVAQVKFVTGDKNDTP